MMRLIDADTLLEAMKTDVMDGLNYRHFIEEAPTIEPKTKVVAQITFDEDKLREIVHEAVERIKEEYDIVDNTDAVSEWIPCSERLPEEAGRYLCTVGAPYRNPREMYYAPQEWADKSDNAKWRHIYGDYVFDWFVKAWQPLPEPWKRENE